MFTGVYMCINFKLVIIDRTDYKSESEGTLAIIITIAVP